MTGISVEVRPATPEGRLYPRYDEESRIVVVESRMPRNWPFGVDVDGRIVFDLDERRVLANFDIHIPRNRWDKSLDEVLPTSVQSGDLAFTKQAIEQKSFHIPLRARCDQSSTVLRLEFGDAGVDRKIQLSDRCVALLNGNELIGFIIEFKTSRNK